MFNPNTRGNLLVVDDTPANLRLLSAMLTEKGYKVRPVINGQMALMAAQTSPPDLILLDINMPEMDGYEVCRRLKEQAGLADIPVIFISAMDELQDKVKAFSVGGLDYITKPFQVEEVLMRVNTHLTLRCTQRELETVSEELRAVNQHLEERVEEQVAQISTAHIATIFALAKLADSRDPETGRHLERVSQLCKQMALCLAGKPGYRRVIDECFIANLTTASALHDIGKVGIPDQILLKPGKLTPDEFAVMKTHALIGANALREVNDRYPGNELIKMGIAIAESHHERWDGTGYPYGLAGEQIPLVGRILALVDVYDALTSVRPYKKAFSHRESYQILLAERGRHFDPAIVDCFVELEGQFESIKDQVDSLEGVH